MIDKIIKQYLEKEYIDIPISYLEKIRITDGKVVISFDKLLDAIIETKIEKYMEDRKDE